MIFEGLLIRHIPTGKYIPKVPDRFRGGGSAMEPEYAHLKQPRLFANDKAAKSFLGQWLKGKHIGDPDGGVCHIRPISSRLRAEMEIVPAKLVVEP